MSYTARVDVKAGDPIGRVVANRKGALTAACACAWNIKRRNEPILIAQEPVVYALTVNLRSFYLVNFDGSPAVLLGNGAAGDISADNKWVTSILPSDLSKVLLLPTGIGETKTITASHFQYKTATWASDSQRLIISGSDSERPVRVWVQDTAGGAPRPVTPEGIDGLALAINHSDYICARDSSRAVQLYGTAGGPPKNLSFIRENEHVIGGSPHSNDIYLSKRLSAASLEVEKVNITTAKREPMMTIAPLDPAGITHVFGPALSGDGKRYVYGQVRELSVLYVASGLK